MREKSGRLGRKTLALLLTLTLVLGIIPMALADGTDTYAVSVAASATEVRVGDTVTLTATVTKNGVAVTDWASEGLYLWWWTDTWNGHSDGNGDAAYRNYDNNSGHSLTADVTVKSEGTYYIAAELKDSSNRLAVTYTTLTVSAATAEMKDIPLPNGDFETGDTTNWITTGFSQVTRNGNSNQSYLLNLWLSDSKPVAGSAAYTVALTAGTYQFAFDISGSMGDCLRYSVTAEDGTVLSDGTGFYSPGWDVWMNVLANAFTLTKDTEVTFTLSGTVPAHSWGYLDNLTLKGTGSIVETEEPPVTAPIDVEKVSGLSEDFIMGMDISSVVSEFKSGVTYKDFDGNTIGNITDFCKFLKTCGVTHIRVRVWNDPFDASGNGYGGGNNDVDTAVKIAEGCAAAGLKLLVDFHCSDFWTDPGKQMVPKAWQDYTLEQKSDALKKFLTDSLTEIQKTGAVIDMVQVGNETTGGFIGETGAENMCTLFSAGSAAIRNLDSSIKVVIHITNPEKGNLTKWAANLSANNVDYDILATSYYPYWHGTLDNLKSEMKAVQDTYGKKVMVAETSFAFTLDDTDGHENTVRVGSNDTGMAYPFSVQGQANCIRDIIAAVSEAGGLGVFYWEPAWITVGDITGLEGNALIEREAQNKALWEKNGSGWASTYAAEYDPDDAGKWYGGSAVDNQALFAADGSPLASLNVWKYVRTGAASKYVTVESIENVEETIEQGGTYTLPKTVTVTYNKGTQEETVKWNNSDVKAIDINTPGTYVVHGTVTLDPNFEGAEYSGDKTAEVTYTLTVKGPNLIGDDWSFEKGSANFSGLNSTGKGIDKETPYEGSYCLHWYLAKGGSGTVTYLGQDKNGITLEPGTYTFECVAQGYAGDTVTLQVLMHDTETVLASGDAVTLTGWNVWQTPTVTILVKETTTVDLRMVMGIQEGGWGTIDCMYLHVGPDCAHELHEVNNVSATCTEDGLVREQCGQCGAIATTVLPALGHDWVEGVNAEAPTLLMPGYTGDTVCSRCGTVLEEGVVLPALGVLSAPTVDKPNSPMAFTDVKTGDWFYSDVKYVYENGLMNGTSDSSFSPNATLTRGMIVTILYRMEGAPSTRYNGMFADVSNYQWYTDAVEWAAKNGIVKGYDNGKFGAEDPVTREQLATILYRYAQYKGMNAVTLAENLTGFADSGNASSYAVPALNWAVGRGLINGSGGKLLPQDHATRAQVAAIIHRFLEGS